MTYVYTCFSVFLTVRRKLDANARGRPDKFIIDIREREREVIFVVTLKNEQGVAGRDYSVRKWRALRVGAFSN